MASGQPNLSGQELTERHRRLCVSETSLSAPPIEYSNWAGLTGLGSIFPGVPPSAFLGACSLRNLRQIEIDVL